MKKRIAVVLCVLAAVLLKGEIQIPVKAQENSAQEGASLLTETDGVTVNDSKAFMEALSGGRSPITVAGNVTIGEEVDENKQMRPVVIPANTVIRGSSDGVINSRSPIQLAGDGIIFKDIELHFTSTDGMGSVPHREIFLAGHSLTLDNVDTYLKGGAEFGELGGTEAELLPTVYAGGYSGTAVGGNASLAVVNSNENTMFQGIYMGHDAENDNKVPYKGSVVVNLDAKAIVRDVVDISQNSQADVCVSGTGAYSAARARKFSGNANTNLTLTGVLMESTGADTVRVQDIGNIVLKNKACLVPVTNTLNNVTLREGACLDLNGIQDVKIAGNFSGEDDPAKDRGILILNKEGAVTIGGSITGTTQFQTGLRPNPGILISGKSYIFAEAENAAEENFVLAQKKVDDGYELKYEANTWTVYGGLVNDWEIGSIKILSAPSKVDLRTILTRDEVTIPNEDIYFEVEWYDTDGKKFSEADIIDYRFYDADCVIGIPTEAWKSDDANEEEWYPAIYLIASEENPGKYYLEAYEETVTGDYTFLFCSNYFDVDSLSTVGDVKTIKDIVMAECHVFLYNQDDIEVPDHTHEYQSEVKKAATCTQPGIRIWTCNCGNTYTESIKASGHKEVIDPAVPPTETETGKTEGSHCSVCGETLKAQETIPATGEPESPGGSDPGPSQPHEHKYQSVETKSPTCTQPGIRAYTCSCGDTYTEEIKASGHKEVIDPAVPPTKTETGKTEGSHCSVCGETFKAQETIPATGEPESPEDSTDPGPSQPHKHAYQSAVTRKSTCTQPGIRTYTCSCGASYTEKLPLADHQYVRECIPATPNSSGKRQQVCRVCAHVAEVTEIDSPQKLLLGKDSYSYDGKVKKPAVTVKDSKGKALAGGTDYRVSYPKGRKNPGVYTVTVEFQGNYSGRMTSSFTIKPKKTSLKKVTARSKGIQVTWKKQTAQIDGYQIQYGTSKSFTGKATKLTTAKKNTTTKKISKLKGKKKYYVRIRTYKTVKVNGKSRKLYSDWSGKKAVSTKK